MNKENYINAINEFNNVKSFNILLPKEEEYYKELIPYTDNIISLTQELADLERRRQYGFSNENKLSSEICLFVVHLNQVSNGIKKSMC